MFSYIVKHAIKASTVDILYGLRLSTNNDSVFLSIRQSVCLRVLLLLVLSLFLTLCWGVSV